MKFFLKNFREFAVRGTVVDMGIGVIVGTAFIKIVNSFVADIIMPPIGLILGRVDFSNLYINLSGGYYRSLTEAKEAGAVTINYGIFIDSIINFAIVAMATYFTILQINRIKKAPKESMSSKECPFCFSNIPTRAVKCSQCTSSLDIDSSTPEKKLEEKLEELQLWLLTEQMQVPTFDEPSVTTNEKNREIKINFNKDISNKNQFSKR